MRSGEWRQALAAAVSGRRHDADAFRIERLQQGFEQMVDGTAEGQVQDVGAQANGGVEGLG